jgi:Tn3 transposase DDE domain
VVLADALDLGITKVAEACPGTRMAKLSWLVAWHIRHKTCTKALAELINCLHQMPFATFWGEGTTSGAQGYRAGSRGEPGDQINAKYSNESDVLSLHARLGSVRAVSHQGDQERSLFMLE